MDQPRQRHSNNSDYKPVVIYFADPDINDLFSELLQSLGLETEVVNSLNGLSSECRVITEPQFFPTLDPLLHSRCLVVGNKRPEHPTQSLFLARPLTEEKVEAALSQFLAR